MTLHRNRLIGEIAATIPGAIEAFGTVGIDCCRDAGLTIEQISLRTGIRPGRIAALLQGCCEQQTPAMDWATAPLAVLTRYVAETVHPGELATMERISDRLAIEQHDHPSDVAIGKLRSAFAELANNLAIHVWREQNEVFPFIQELEKAQGNAPPSCARGSPAEPHDPILEALRRLREITHHYTAPAIPPSMAPLLGELAAFDAMIHRHIHLDNHVLYPRASALCACPVGESDTAAALSWF